MNLRTIRFFLRETLLNIKRNSHSGIVMLAQTIVSLLILGICLIFIFNANHLVTNFFNNLEINVFLADTTDEVSLAQLQRQIKVLDGVGDMKYISKEDAYQWMKKNSPYNLDELVKRNPFPASLRIKVQSTKSIDSIAKEIGTMAGVEEVNYAAESLGKILPIFYFIQVSCFFLSIILAGMTLFSITNTVKLAIHSRRQEIRIMRLVGATDRFIRWPFVLEGMFYGFAGAFAAFLLASGAYALVMKYINMSNPVISLFVSTGQVMLNLGVLLGVIGILVGMVGSFISVDRHLVSRI
jgi:cell division transport system permease protein